MESGTTATRLSVSLQAEIAIKTTNHTRLRTEPSLPRGSDIPATAEQTAPNCLGRHRTDHPGTSQPRRVLEHADSELIALLRGRDGPPTDVPLRDGRRLRVFNIAWGYDDGDLWAHVTTTSVLTW